MTGFFLKYNLEYYFVPFDVYIAFFLSAKRIVVRASYSDMNLQDFTSRTRSNIRQRNGTVSMCFRARKIESIKRLKKAFNSSCRHHSDAMLTIADQAIRGQIPQNNSIIYMEHVIIRGIKSRL